MEGTDPYQVDDVDFRWAWLLVAAVGVAGWAGSRLRARGALRWLGLAPAAAPDNEMHDLLEEARREQRRRSVVDQRQEEVVVSARLRRRQRLQHRRETLLREAEEAEKKYVGAGTYLDRDPIERRSKPRDAPPARAAVLAEQDAEYEASMMADLRRDWEREEERRVAAVAAAAEAGAETKAGNGDDATRARSTVTLPQPPAPQAGDEVVTCVILVPGGRRTRFAAPASSPAACLSGAIMRLLGRAGGVEAAPGTSLDARAWVATVGVPARTVLRGPRAAAISVGLAAETDGPEAGRDTWQAMPAPSLDSPIGDLGVNGAAVRVAFTDDGC